MILLDEKAAQYVRMSTDMQHYSIENQKELIGLYAASRGLTIVRSYEDAGRSGIGLNGRAALQCLLADVCSGRAEFSTVLVYDVSRWGRFQDSDESAHYEYLCRRAGVKVEYCAELFQNDGSLTSAVIKNIKRAMAGEYSRELSVKVFAGQSRLTLHGFHVGATAGYGLRRVLVDECGNEKMPLSFGQRKNLQSERVKLVLGPTEEVETVRRMYSLLLNERRSPLEIAKILNAKKVASEFSKSWTQRTVQEILSNEKYIGNAVYNRTSKKLNSNWHRNPESEWVRGVGAYPPIIAREVFEQARQRLADLARPLTDNDLLDMLSALWCKEGHLNTLLVDHGAILPGSSTYATRFGSMASAFRRIGFKGRENLGKNADLRKAIIADLTEQITRRGGSVRRALWCKQLVVNDEIKINICISRLKSKGPRVWQFGYVSQFKPDILVGARIAEKGGAVVDYFILPFMFLPHGSWVTTSLSSALRLERFRSSSLAPLYDLCARTKVDSRSW